MKVDVSTVLPCSFEQAVSHAITPRLLLHVASPLVRFTPIDPPAFPAVWSAGTHWVDVKLFGFLPFGKQAVVISMPPAGEGFSLRDAGHSALIRVWDHLITIDPGADGTRYRDQLEIRAGLLTPFVWLFARVFFRHRQRRWRRLAASGFDYGDA